MSAIVIESSFYDKCTDIQSWLVAKKPSCFSSKLLECVGSLVFERLWILDVAKSAYV